MKSGSDFIGQVEIPILDIIDKKKGDEWFDLEKRKDKDKVSGKVHLKYSYEFVEEVANVKSKKEDKKVKVDKKKNWEGEKKAEEKEEKEKKN